MVYESIKGIMNKVKSRKGTDYHCSHAVASAIPAEPENLLPAGKYHTWGAEPG